MKPNMITSENYKSMWCKHAFSSHLSASTNSGAGIPSYCIGRSCPSLIFKLTSIKGKEGWIGICGVDHKFTAQELSQL